MIRIAHLSDIHLDNSGIKDFNAFVMKALIKDLENFNKNKPIDLVLFTGDLVHKGGESFDNNIAKAFNKFNALVITPISEKIGLRKDRFFFTPGNHDILRSEDDDVDEAGLERILKNTAEVNKKIDMGDSDSKGIKRILPYKNFEAEYFKDYDELFKITNYQSNFVALVNKYKIGITCLNSAWRCYDSKNDQGKILIGERQVTDSRNLIENCDLSVALLHHTTDWLKKFDQDAVCPFIEKDYDILLCGHGHLGSSYSRNGIYGNQFVSIAPANWTNDIRDTDRIYANGFTIIDYDLNSNDIITYSRRYNHSGERYDPNTDLGDDKGIRFYKNASPGIKQTGEVKYSLKNQSDFINKLGNAEEVIIIGITNKYLLNNIEEALKIKRSQKGSDAFWKYLRILFLSERILGTIDDELKLEFPIKDQASQYRIKLAGQAKSALLYYLIRSNNPHNWFLYEYDYTPPFIGELYKYSDNRQEMEYALIKPGVGESDYLYTKIEGNSEEASYFESIFNDVVNKSTQQEEIVLVGYPKEANNEFVCQHTKFRRSLLMYPNYKNDWILCLLIVLWQKKGNEIIPILQIRTKENSAREYDRISNIAGYVTDSDCYEISGKHYSEFIVDKKNLEKGVFRELSEELGLDNHKWSRPKLIDGIKYYYPDRENLFFYIFTQLIDIPVERIHPLAHINPMHFNDMLKVREYQVMNNLLEFLNRRTYEDINVDIAIQIAYDNLILHRQEILANEIIEVFGKKLSFEKIKGKINNHIEDSRSEYDYKGENRVIKGFAGLQYREFFNSLLRIYSDLNIKEAKEYLDWIKNNDSAKNALKRLMEHYGNQNSINELKIEV